MDFYFLFGVESMIEKVPAIILMNDHIDLIEDITSLGILIFIVRFSFGHTNLNGFYECFEGQFNMSKDEINKHLNYLEELGILQYYFKIK